MRALLTAALVAALLVPLALAQQEASPVTLLVYRPWPDPQAGGADADRLATALAPPPAGLGRVPATLVDRTQIADPAPERQPQSAPAHYREITRQVALREADDRQVGLRVSGAVKPGALDVEVETLRSGDRAPARVELSVVLFEHGVPVGGTPQPYVARFALAPVQMGVPDVVVQQVRLDPAWDVDRLGVVAFVRENETVLQSATWLPRQDAPTEQLRKAVLVEHVTASWCEPCRPVDDALALLAAQRGPAGALAAGDVSYQRAPGALFYTGLALGALVAVALVRRRDA